MTSITTASGREPIALPDRSDEDDYAMGRSDDEEEELEEGRGERYEEYADEDGDLDEV